MESKHTKGFAKSDKLHIYVDGKRIGQTILMSFNHDNKGRRIKDVEGYANAEFIAEAFNVANETGMTPRELQKSHAELLEALGSIKDLHSRHYKFYSLGNGFIEEADEVIEKAITNATKK